MAGVNCQLKGFDIIKKQIESEKKGAETVLKRTLSDVRSRAPGWVATEVVKEYGVKKGEITGNKLGRVKVEGNTMKEAKIIYTGRTLTPTHFGMTPKAPGKNAYTLKASIIKEQKATLGKVKKLTKKQRAALAKNLRGEGTRTSDHSPIMLMHTGNAQENGTSYIPFQRKSKDRKDVEAIKTVSLPQMVSSERTAPNISKAINDGLEKRLDHHMTRLGL